MAAFPLLSLAKVVTAALIISAIPNLSMDHVSTREGLLEVGKKRKAAIREGIRILIDIGTGKETRRGKEVRIGTEKRTVTVITETVVGIEVGSGVKGEKGEEIEMMMIITEVETMIGEGIMTEIGGTGIGVVLVDLNTDQSQGPALAHPQRAKGLVALTWHLLLQQC